MVKAGEQEVRKAKVRLGAPSGQCRFVRVGCQSRDRVRLTDQALVAITVARRVGEERHRHPTGVDVLVGLAAEGEGHAGVLLRALPTAAARLTDRAASAPPGLPPLEHVVARAGAAEPARPVPTGGLLAALLEAGGPDVADLLTACGYDARALYRAATDDAGVGTETFGLGSDPDLAADAAVAVARVRAAAGGAVDLVLAIAAAPGAEELIPEDPEGLAALLAMLHRHGEPQRAGEDWDRGLDGVLAAARTWCEPPIGTRDLLRTAIICGGRGPARLLEAADRRTDDAP